MVADAEWRPVVAITVYVPERSATKRPSSATWAAAPAAMIVGAVSPPTANRTGTPRTGSPRASLAVAVNRTTSPVDAAAALARSSSEVTGLVSTSMTRRSLTSPAVAMISTDPGACRVRNPKPSISAAPASADANATGMSVRTAPTASTTSTESRGRVPT